MAKQRNVDFVLRLVTGDDNARAASEFAKHIKDIEQNYKNAGKAAKEASAAMRAPGRTGRGVATAGGTNSFGLGYDKAAFNEAKRIAADERRERELNIRDMQSAAVRERRILADRIRANVEASAAIRKAANDANAASWKRRQTANTTTPQAPIDFKGHVEGLGRQWDADQRAQRDLSRQQARDVAEFARANRELLSGLKQTATGVSQVARAFVLLGVTSEENLEVAIRTLAKFEAGVQGLAGLVNLIEGGAKAWRSYAAAATVAAAAQARMGVAGGVGAIGLGSSVLAGAGAFGVGAGVGAALSIPLYGRQTAMGAWKAAGDWAGVTDFAGQRRQAQAGNSAFIRDRLSAQRGFVDQRYDDYTALGALSVNESQQTGGYDAGIKTANRIAAEARARRNDIERRVGQGIGGDFEVVQRERVAAAASENTALRTAVALEKERLSLIKDAVQAEKAKTDALLEGIKQSKISIGQADADQLALANEAVKKFQQGGAASQEESAAARALGLNEVADKQDLARGQEALAGLPELAGYLKRLEEETRNKGEKQTVEVISKITSEIKVTNDPAKLIRDLEGAIKAAEEQLREAARRELEQAMVDRDAAARVARGNNGL